MTSPHLPPEGERRASDRDYDEWTDPRQRSEMPFLEHLEELRRVLFHSLIAVVVGAVGAWWLAPYVMRDTIGRTVRHVIFTSPFEPFNERIKLTLILAFVIVLPFLFWRLWRFVMPGLLKRERQWVAPLSAGSYVLFLAGAASSYFYVTPIVIHLMVGTFAVPGMVAQVRIEDLMDTLYNLSIACGVLAQLPLVTMLLTAIGIVTPQFLLRQWRYAVVVIFIITAGITPGDVVSAQVIMGIPMVALYLLSVGLSFFVAKRRRDDEPSHALVLSDDDREDDDHD